MYLQQGGERFFSCYIHLLYQVQADRFLQGHLDEGMEVPTFLNLYKVVPPEISLDYWEAVLRSTFVLRLQILCD